MASIRWARANLYYVGDGQRNPYRFRRQHDPTMHSNSAHDFFRFMDSRPGGSTSSARNETPPCTRVYPHNIWKTPTRVQYDLLNAATTCGIRSFHLADYVAYVGASHNIGPPSYLGINLRFERNGWAQETFLPFVPIPVHSMHTDAPRQGFYWSNGPGYYRFHIAGNNSSNYETDVGTSSTQGGGASTPNNWGSVRCIRQ